MLENKKIKELLKNNHGDLQKFADFIGISREGLYYKLKCGHKKDSLYGVYQEFLISLKGK